MSYAGSCHMSSTGSPLDPPQTSVSRSASYQKPKGQGISPSSASKFQTIGRAQCRHVARCPSCHSITPWSLA